MPGSLHSEFFVVSGLARRSNGSELMKVAILATDNREHYKDYATPAPHFGTAPEALLQGFAALPELEVHILSCIRQKVQSPARLAPNIFFHSLLVPKLGWIRTGYQGCIRATRAKLREISPDLVHAQGTERDCGVCGVLSGFPNILTIHGNMRRVAQVLGSRPFSYIWLAARLERWTVPRTQGVVCITRHTLSQVDGLARRTWVVPNAVDASFFEVQPSPAAPPRFVCVGQVYPLKNQVALIRALDPLAARHPFVLEFLGEANPEQPYAAEFLSLVRTRPWCSYSGFADRATLKARLSEATALAQVSLEDNCPMAVLEAMAAGVPVFAGKLGGLPDLVKEGVTGFLCDPRDSASMLAAAEKMLQNPSATQQMGANARKDARERFHPLVVARRHVEIYQEVLGRR